MSVHDQITSMLDRAADAWKINDGAAVADFFVEDGVLINPFGERADGRTAVAAMYSQYFGGMLRGTSVVTKLTSLRNVEGQHAFIDAEQTIRAADGSVVLVAHLASLMRRDGDTWCFVDARPYIVAAPPR